ncbi:adenylate kinase 8-like [Argiope bruennichi]|uniref:Adenylate kinase 8 like protein n=1 Tax=Argiope bruennichi TaxID=94029 RepID=A0A8T0EEF6_ARGBR|nr:adenylate kinase 8-like [Argiope bruennichi]KAF8770104.1 Adenylate kinase 8 like protein [Argiope bruennichi]
MDATHRPHEFPKELFAYAENKKVFQIFQTLLERLVIDRPEKPVDFLYDLVTKSAVYDVPRVYVLGPPTIDRKLVCAALASKLNLVYLNQQSLNPQDEAAGQSEERSQSFCSELPKLMKERVEQPDCVKNGWLIEAFPKTRRHAMALRKLGVFPTHIVVVDDPVISQRVTLRSCPEVSDILSKEGLQEMLDYLGQVDLILDLHSKSYWKKFRIGYREEVEKSIDKVIDFVRSRQRPIGAYLPRVLLLGPYGSGRRTMAKRLAQRFRLIEVDFRRELRSATLKDSPLKDRLYEIMETTEPVPDELLVEVASERLLKEDCLKSGWIMYHFPDTKKQAQLLVKALEGFQVNRAVFLNATLQTCLERVEPRRWDPATGEIYHLKLRPCTDRMAQVRLLQLPQDAAESVRAEHELYSSNAEDLKDIFKNDLVDDIAFEVDSNWPEEEVFESVQAAVLKSAKMKIPVADENKE